MSVRSEEHPRFCGCQEGLIGYACTCVRACVAVWTVALLRVHGLPSFLSASSRFQAAQGWTSCSGSWDSLKRPTERALWRVVRISLGQQTPQKGANSLQPNISSITELTLWGLHSRGAGAPTPWCSAWGVWAVQRNGAVHTRGKTNARTHVSTAQPVSVDKKKKCRGYEYIYVRKESTHPRQKTQKQEGTSHKGCRDGLTHIISLQ